MSKNIQSRAPQTVLVRMIPNNRMLQYLGVSGIGRMLLTTLEALKGLLHTKDYGFIKSSLVASDISSILGNKGLLCVEGTGHKVKRGYCCRLLLCYHIKGLVPELGSKRVEIAEKVIEEV